MEDSKEESISSWKEITKELDEACNDLDLGEMIHKEGFILIEAMSAIEIMDPKMDTGMNEPVFSLEERLEQDLLPIETSLSISEIIGILDYLLAVEYMWYSGFSLVQTVFTCLYLHKPSMINNEYLSIYSKSYLKCLDQIRTDIIKADVFEEEDFITHTFNFSLANEFSDVDTFSNLKGIEEKLANRLRKLKDPNTPPEEIETPLQNDKSKEEEYCQALLSRFQFRRSYYMAHVYFNKSKMRGLDSARKSITIAHEQIKIIRQTLHLGKVPTGVFDPSIVRRLNTPTPTRVIEMMNLDEALTKFEKQLELLEELPTISNCVTLKDFQDFFFTFTNNLNVDIVVRSRLMLLFYSQKLVLGNKPPIELIKESMLSLGIPSTSHVDNPLSVSFLEKVTMTVINSFRFLCYNRARQRRKISRSFEDWSNLQDESILLDSNINVPSGSGNNDPSQSPFIHYFGCWLLEQTIIKMVLFLRLGFELDIYNSWEFGMIFWYLDYLFGNQQQNLLYLREIETERKQKKTKGKKTKKNLKKPLTPTTYQLLIETQHLLCRGIFRHIFALNFLLKIEPPKFPFGSDEIRFYQRFAPFGKLIQPSPLFYNQFIETTEFKNLKAEDLFSGSSDSYKQCKSLIEKLIHQNSVNPKMIAELKSMAKVAITNTLQIQLLSNKKTSIDKKVNFDFTAHSFYPTISAPK